MSAVLASLQQVVTTLTALVTQLQGQVGGAQAQAGAAGVQGGGATTGVAGDAGTAPAGTAPAADAGATVEGGGAPAKDPVQTPPTGGGCGCAHGAALGVAQTPDQGSPAQDTKPAKAERASAGQDAKAAEMKASPAQGGDGKLNSDALTVKGAKMNAEQRRLTEIVLRTGKEMGANRKVLETAVATMIQESTIKNDASVDSKDHDSLGLFQQRPSAGWGTRAQISDPEYAAKKFFEKAIPNDRKNPDQAKTRLAQSVQISAFPDAYARWDKEAEKIVADYLG